MTGQGALPRVLRTALDSPGGNCYRHCHLPIQTRTVKSRLPGTFHVRACPSGVVSVCVYTEWSRRDPSRAVESLLERWAVPHSLVRWRDLRRATRHGPELGRAAERFLASNRRKGPVQVVYWRVYPFRARDGTERRLFVCLRRGHSSPVFFTASPDAETWECPRCRRRASAPSASTESARG